MKRFAAAIVCLLILTACGSRSSAVRPTPAGLGASPVVTASPLLTATALPTLSPTGTATASATSSAPSVTCTTGVATRNLVLMGDADPGYLLYEVTDPVHPKLLCRISSTSAHIVSTDSIAYLKPASATESDVVIRSLQTGAESKAASFPYNGQGSPFGTASWWPDGSLLSYTSSPDNPGPDSSAQVWLYANQTMKPLTTYPWPLTDCICRFGLGPQINAISPDGHYLASGWPIGKGAQPFTVSRVADRSQVQVFDPSVTEVLWARTGHQLFLSGQSGVRSWTPETGFTPLAGSSQWMFLPSLSPDGGQVVYTAYLDQAQTQLRVFLFDFATKATRQLSDQPRSQVMFVKGGWVWYLDEASCQSGQGQCPPWGSNPTGNVYAEDLATGHETQVVFAAGEAPVVITNWYVFQPHDLWPVTQN